MLEVLGFTGEGGGESSLLRRLPRPWRAGVGSLCPGDGISTPTQGHVLPTPCPLPLHFQIVLSKSIRGLEKVG